LPWRDDSALNDWLVERQSLGLKTVHASLAGVGEVHDFWNGRAGNFDLIMRTLQAAGDLGLALGARLFVSKSTLPHLAALNERLERLPKHEEDWRYATPFFYFGWGAWFEDERIDEAERDALPSWMKPLVERDGGAWRSEREWIAHLSSQPPRKADETQLVINVDDDNIAMLENSSCEEIIGDYERRTRAAYAALPTLDELCDRYGDKDGALVYPLLRCVETKWLDMHLAREPISFERRLTHLQIGS
jgi:hypothetical protein